MRKVILYMATSIDGFVASPDGGVDWILTDVELESEYGFESFVKTVDTLLMGRASYEQTVSFGDWPFSDHRIVVYSNKDFEPSTPNTSVRKFDPKFIEKLKNEEGKDLWLFGGGALNHTFLEHDLIDEMMVFVQPTVLGSGIGLFGNRPIDPKHFIRKAVHELGGGFTLLHYMRKA